MHSIEWSFCAMSVHHVLVSALCFANLYFATLPCVRPDIVSAHREKTFENMFSKLIRGVFRWKSVMSI